MSSPQPTPRDYRVGMDIRAAIILLTGDPNTPRTAAEIHRLLGQREEFEGRVPSRRTVERIVHELAQQRLPAPWHWSDYAPEDARVLLNVMDELVGGNIESDDPDLARDILEAIPDFYRSSLIDSKEIADWIVRIGKVDPALHPFMVFMMAHVYVLHQRVGASTSGLDTYLAMHPWKDEESAVRYVQALGDKLIPSIAIQERWFVGTLLEFFQIYSNEVQEEKNERPPNQAS